MFGTPEVFYMKEFFLDFLKNAPLPASLRSSFVHGRAMRDTQVYMLAMKYAKEHFVKMVTF
jgi:hypothetical protein